MPAWRRRSVDLHLNQLREMGVFDKIAGLLIGRPQGLMPVAGTGAGTGAGAAASADAAAPAYGFADLLQEQLAGYSFPAAWGVDFGHTDPMLTLPLGVDATIDTVAQTIALNEAAVLR
ncbi:MAG: hypothetical protein ACYC5Y_14920 [Symbiobacteriia bacterium]